jgi:subtilisin family serine protease
VAALAATFFSGDGLGAPRALPMTEVVVTLDARPLADFGRSLSSARHRAYGRELLAAQQQEVENVLATVPGATVRWRYHLVADGFSVVLPKADVGMLKSLPGVAHVWPSVSYHALDSTGPEVIGADQLWSSGLTTAGNGIKIGIIDDGVDASHPYFDPTGYSYPPGFPKGQTRYTTPKVIVQRAFPPPNLDWKYGNTPFDPKYSFHATHVAGIAAGDNGLVVKGARLSGVAPKAYIGNYKVLTVPTLEFGLDGNSAEIAAGIEAAVADGMNVINLSLGEPEIDPSQDIVVKALDAAARAGVVPVVAAGNNEGPISGLGTIDSPANAPAAISVGATTTDGQIASFSAPGPTPISLQLKPDVSAPGVDITSSVPANQGHLWTTLDGTSMAAPHVAGGAALLMQLHPSWTVAEIKSALVQTAGPVHNGQGNEVSAMREGGGLVDLPQANDPLLFAAPTGIAFKPNGGRQTVHLKAASAAGAGTWSASVDLQQHVPGVTVTTPPTVAVPGALAVTANATAAAAAGDVSGFVVLTLGSTTRRIPFWLEVSHPKLGTEPHLKLSQPGDYSGSTAGGESKVSLYRYPSGSDVAYPGPEVVYRVTFKKPVRNFGVAVLSGTAVPHIVFAGNEDHLAGFTALPYFLNPYFPQWGDRRQIAGVVGQGPGTFDIVFDTRGNAQPGPFRFRYWVNDTTPPKVRIVSAQDRSIDLSLTDAGSGVDPRSLEVILDGRAIVSPDYKNGTLVIRTTRGKHHVLIQVSDYQESKNTEDVARVTPNTTIVSGPVVVR